LYTNFHQIWQVAAAINAEQYVLKLSTSPDMCTHYTHTHTALWCYKRQNCDKYCSFT